MSLGVLPRQFVVDVNGAPLVGAKLHVYAPGTTTHITIHSTSAYGSSQANPLVSDGDGRFPAYYIDPSVYSAYKVVITDADDVPLDYTNDNIPVTLDAAADIGAILNPRTAAEISAGVTPTDASIPAPYVGRYGAVVSVDCTAAVSTAASCNSEVIFPAGAWVINSTPTIPAGVQITAQAGATFTGAGATAIGLSGAFISHEARLIPEAEEDVYAQFQLLRDATYAGGTPGNVSSNLLVRTIAREDTENFEWAATFIMDNYSEVITSQNVAVYAQANKHDGASITWACALEARDDSGNADPSSGLVGLEVGMFANGTDASTQRVGIDIVGAKGITGTLPTIAYGIRIGPQNGDTTAAQFGIGLDLNGIMTGGIRIGLASGSTVGIDLSASTLSESAIKLAQGHSIAFEATDTLEIKYDGTGLGWYNGATLMSRLNAAGSFAIRDGITAPGAQTGMAVIYVDTSDGDLKCVFSDGTVKTIVTDT